MSDSIGVAVIGAGMAGKAHMAAWRNAPSLFGSTLPPVRLVSIGDVYEPLAAQAARRFGYARHDTDWRAIAAADDIDVVSVVVANTLHREIVEGLLAAGKHVLCEKPLADSLEDARAMASAADAAAARGQTARVGFTYRRAPGLAAIKQFVEDSTLGRVLHVSGRYWTDYGSSPEVPFSWRFAGAPGTGALADVGSHLTYVAEFLAGEVRSVNGGLFTTTITERPVAAGHVLRGQQAQFTGEVATVDNDDYATFNARFGGGTAVGSLEVSRVAAAHPNGLVIEVFCENGAARWDQERPSEIGLALRSDGSRLGGYRQVVLGPEHPYVAGGMAMDAPGVGWGQNQMFEYQARAFLDEVTGNTTDPLPANATFDDGVHNMEVLDAVARSAASGGASLDVRTTEGANA
ncbi:Gfo/Idh/MocA family oxidoreductase [Curtobacterium pusillum]|uniref:Gfo/Idh/MocA family oxidoreductase n=1 Tax=Curtobacterium pusillum TaxID=69373 RepID=A0ABX2MBH2_9MICO|nr:Gfo/Idh/MocA family oxidoreductase [Curtobacterium pusillum]NUU14818.1 Gfo/Idh/MocA family oxidoreductase [Curtobacterium pusillum]GLK31633.1 dehydrogenase [Curtobacterium pusillum]